MLQSYNFENNNVRVYGNSEKPLFIASHIATMLGYHKPADAVAKLVNDKYKITKNQIERDDYHESGYMHPATILINEFGLYELIFSSKMPIAIKFKEWIFEEVIPSIRKMGSYNPVVKHNQFVIMNENQLHCQVVKYIRKYYPDVLMTATLGELQDTSYKRSKSFHQGYTSGSSDLLIFEPNHHHNMLTFEFKTPNGRGIISDRQLMFNTKLKNRGTKSIISDDYDHIIKELNDYMFTRRICCDHCLKKFKTERTLNQHQKYFHRIAFDM